jgi:hypothetical protein
MQIVTNNGIGLKKSDDLADDFEFRYFVLPIFKYKHCKYKMYHR